MKVTVVFSLVFVMASWLKTSALQARVRHDKNPAWLLHTRERLEHHSAGNLLHLRHLEKLKIT